MNRGLESLARGLKLELSSDIRAQLEALSAWLLAEGIRTGGLGPGESDQVEERHLTDSLSFAGGWEEPPGECLDLGSGIGLPGLVLAAVWPTTLVTLVDRSEKRCDLARRAARVAGIRVEVCQADIFSWERPFSAIVSRAAVPAERLRPVLERLLRPGGRAVVSGSGKPIAGFVNLMVLDRSTRLLMMQKS